LVKPRKPVNLLQEVVFLQLLLDDGIFQLALSICLLLGNCFLEFYRHGEKNGGSKRLTKGSDKSIYLSVSEMR
jgi:hypothetical protein